ncbi:MAG: S8 family peptidase [Velocimicrobium sp.]
MERVNGLIHTAWAHERKIYGNGIGIAIVDTGIIAHPDFVYRTNRIVAFKDIVNGKTSLYDDNGHGTHVAGCMGGDGYESSGRYTGIAPNCNLIVIKALNYKGNGNIEEVLQGLSWIRKNKVKYNIRILNISVGSSAKKDLDEGSAFVRGVEKIWDDGIIVVAAAGNNGPEGKTIGAPGNSRKIITVGASDDSDYVDFGGGKINNYSSRGPTKACIMKPDIVAPGSNVLSCNYHFIQGKLRTMYAIKSGTSMATPIVSGAIALLLQKYPDMTPREVKIRLKNRAIDHGMERIHQGWGMLDIERLLC